MSLCKVNLVAEDDIDLINSMANSSTDGASVLKAITALTLVIHLKCTLVALCPLILSVQHIVVARATVLGLFVILGTHPKFY